MAITSGHSSVCLACSTWAMLTFYRPWPMDAPTARGTPNLVEICRFEAHFKGLRLQIDSRSAQHRFAAHATLPFRVEQLARQKLDSPNCWKQRSCICVQQWDTEQDLPDLGDPSRDEDLSSYHHCRHDIFSFVLPCAPMYAKKKNNVSRKKSGKSPFRAKHVSKQSFPPPTLCQ